MNAALIYHFSKKNNPLFQKQAIAFETGAKVNGINLSILTNLEALSEIGSFSNSYQFVILYDNDVFLSSTLEDMGMPLFVNTKQLLISNDLGSLYLHLKSKDIPIPIHYTSMEPKGKSLRDCLDLISEGIAKSRLFPPYILRPRFGEQSLRGELIRTPKELINRIGTLNNEAFVVEEVSKGPYLMGLVIGEKCLGIAECLDSSLPGPRNNELVKSKFDTKLNRALCSYALSAAGLEFGIVYLRLDNKEKAMVIGVNPFIRTLSFSTLFNKRIEEEFFLYLKKNRKRRVLITSDDQKKRFEEMCLAASKLDY